MSSAGVYVEEKKLYVCTRERRKATDIDKKSITIVENGFIFFEKTDFTLNAIATK